jgi:hypothetical protein
MTTMGKSKLFKVFYKTNKDKQESTFVVADSHDEARKRIKTYYPVVTCVQFVREVVTS